MDRNNATRAATESMEEMITCSICLEIFTKPKLLACQHSFCESCLVSMKTGQQEAHTTIRCPICNQFTPLPKGGVPDLRSDFRSQQLRDIIDEKNKKSTPSFSGDDSSNQRLCDMCDDARSTSCCVDCVLCLCENCLAHHNENPGLAEHCIEKMGDHMVCNMHNKRLVTMYCSSCGSLCQVCAVKHDPTHTPIKLGVIKEHRQELINTLDQLTVAILNRQEEMGVLYDAEKEKAREAVKEITAGVIRDIKKKEEDFLKEIDNIVKEALCGNDQYLNEMKMVKSDVKLIINRSPQTVFAAYDYLYASIQTIKNSKPTGGMPSENVSNENILTKIQTELETYRRSLGNVK